MNLRLRRLVCAALALLTTAGACMVGYAQDSVAGWNRRMDRIEAEVTIAEDVSAIKRLQRAYGYYLDKGMRSWSDLADRGPDLSERIRRTVFDGLGESWRRRPNDRGAQSRSRSRCAAQRSLRRLSGSLRRTTVPL